MLTLAASTPGLTLPSALALKPYVKDRPRSARSSLPGPEIMLHSATHPKLDYTVHEEASNGSDSYLKHYIGVYDPETGTLQLVQARKAITTSTLRSSRTSALDEKSKEHDTSNVRLKAPH